MRTHKTAARTRPTRTGVTSMPYVRAIPAATPPIIPRRRERRRVRLRRGLVGGGGGAGGAGGAVASMHADCASKGTRAIGNHPDVIPDVHRDAGARSCVVATVRRAVTRSELTRPDEGRMIAGVAAGLADALAIDRNVVRCGFVVLTIASGLG